jgi:hypothetical protein
MIGVCRPAVHGEQIGELSCAADEALGRLGNRPPH